MLYIRVKERLEAVGREVPRNIRELVEADPCKYERALAKVDEITSEFSGFEQADPYENPLSLRKASEHIGLSAKSGRPESFSQKWKRPGGRSRARIESFCMKEVQAALGLGLPKEHERTLRIYLSIQRVPGPFEARKIPGGDPVPKLSSVQHRMRKQKRRPPKQPGRILLRAAQLGRLSLDAQRAAAEGDCATAIELQEKLNAELGRLNKHYKQTHIYAALDRTWFPDCLGRGPVAWAAKDLTPRESLARFGFVEGGPSAALWLQDLFGVDLGHLCTLFNWRHILANRFGPERGATVAAALLNQYIPQNKSRGRPKNGQPSKWELIACWCRQFLGPGSFRKPGGLDLLAGRLKKRVEFLKLKPPDLEEIRDTCAADFEELQESTL